MRTVKHLFDMAKVIFVALLLIYIGFIVTTLWYHGFQFIRECLQGAAIRSVREPWSAAFAKLFYIGLAAFGTILAGSILAGLAMLLKSCAECLAFERYLMRGGVPQFYRQWQDDPLVYERLAFPNIRRQEMQQ